jgi:hypothetical protein
MTIEIQAIEDDEAGYAFRWGQEARKAHELDKRLNAIIFDMGLICNMIEELLDKLNAANILDQKFDCEDHLRAHLLRPIGSLKEVERFQELVERIRDHRATQAEQEEFDKLSQEHFIALNKQFLQEHSDWLEATEGFDSEEHRRRHRGKMMKQYANLFAKIVLANDTDGSRTKEFLETIAQLAARSAECSAD